MWGEGAHTLAGTEGLRSDVWESEIDADEWLSFVGCGTFGIDLQAA